MPTHQINFAQCRGLPAPKEIVAAMEEFGLAETEEVGVLHADVASGAAFGTLVRRTNVAVQKLNNKTREVFTENVERVTLIPFGLYPAGERMEVYAGSGSAIQELAAFLTSGLAMAVVTDEIELDMESAVEKLIKETKKFQLRAIRISDFAANSYMIGPYAPKFMDTEHGQKFLGENAEAVKNVQVRFAGPTGRASAKLTPEAAFGYSCPEDDQPIIQEILRKLVAN